MRGDDNERREGEACWQTRGREDGERGADVHEESCCNCFSVADAVAASVCASFDKESRVLNVSRRQ